MRRVLRLRSGEHVTLLDNSGWAFEAILEGNRGEELLFAIIKQWQPLTEPSVHLTLYQAVLKGEHFAWVLQKGTEIGVARFVPVISARNVVDDIQAIENKRPRWLRIIQEAAEQAGRSRLPGLAAPMLLTRAIRPGADSVGETRLIPWEEEGSRSLTAALAGCNLGAGSRIGVFVGPEGGYEVEEVRQAEQYGILPVTLGPRILRAETAGLVAASAILFAAGDLDSSSS